MARVAEIICTVDDVHGVSWDVRERRSTLHGFDVLLGWPSSAQRGRGGQGPAVIPTAALAEYLAVTRLRSVELPIGTSTAKRVRAGLGLRWDWDAWWASRADDLRSMTLETFCARHGCSLGAASQRRAALSA